jgi:D-beta-D-heptose 7-phosphate kinase/D-beta-D-heptose 1-phosphate adenosyltransferase
MLNVPIEKPILVIGDVMLDRNINGKVLRLAPEAPTPVIEVESEVCYPGGAANVAANLSALHVPTILIGLTGSDQDHNNLLDVLKRYSRVKPELLMAESRTTTVKTRVLVGNHQYLRIDRDRYSPGNEEILNLLKFANNIDRCSAVILSDYGKGVFNDKAFTQEVIRLAKLAKLNVYADPKGGGWERFRGATVLKPNELEVALVTGLAPGTKPNIATMSKTCRAACLTYGINNVVATAGDRGMLWTSAAGAEYYYATKPTPIYNVSGAGDVSMAVLSAALTSCYEMDKAIWMANLAAGYGVTKPGTSLVPWFELNDLMGKDNYKHKVMLRRWENDHEFFELIRRYVRHAKKRNQRLVFTNGCFDMLHDGHVEFLATAKKQGELLVVAVNSDDSVRELKGPDRPLLGMEERMTVLSALSCVDVICPFRDEKDLEAVIRAFNPCKMVKGIEYQHRPLTGADWVAKHGGQIKFLDVGSATHLAKIMQKITRSS